MQAGLQSIQQRVINQTDVEGRSRNSLRRSPCVHSNVKIDAIHEKKGGLRRREARRGEVRRCGNHCNDATNAVRSKLLRIGS